MNGAELPSGIQLRVEPSQSNARGANSKIGGSKSVASDTADNAEGAPSGLEENNLHEEPVDDELDDFFSSI